jgi:hypothetical protein
MRYRDILLEYDVNRTLQRYGEPLLNRLTSEMQDIYVQALWRNADSSARAEVAKPNAAFLSPEQLQQVRKIIARKFIERIEEYDPSPNKQFMSWLLSRYINGGIRRFEDFAKAREFLGKHMQLRQSGYFKRHPDANAAFGDIGRFQTLSDLGEFIISVEPELAKSNSQKERELEAEMIKDHEVQIIYDDVDWKVVIPLSERAACFYGRNTQWCTAAKDSNQFSYYDAEGPLYVILQKATNRRWQFHFETGQFMDENDRSIDWKNFPEAFFALDVIDYGKMSWKGRRETILDWDYAESEMRKILLTLSKEELALVLLSFPHRSPFQNKFGDIVKRCGDYEINVDEEIFKDDAGSCVITSSEDEWADIVISLAERCATSEMSTFMTLASDMLGPAAAMQSPTDVDRRFGARWRGWADVKVNSAGRELYVFREGRPGANLLHIRRMGNSPVDAIGGVEWPDILSQAKLDPETDAHDYCVYPSQILLYRALARLAE